MALEPITRQEKIIAGENLTPITRMEKFLKNFGGGGGGSVPKPLTYDYMPEGYPSKSGWSIEWDGNTDGLISVAGEYYKVSDMVPTDDELIGATIETSAGESFKLSSNYINAVTEDITLIGEGLALIVRKDNATFNNVTIPQKGTYFTVARDFYTTRLSTQTITPMAEEFLPSEIKELIMNSSTTGSTKKFKITVDDNGTISATEVT